MRTILKEKMLHSVDTFLIRKPGPLTTVQDQGRKFYQWFGMPVSGVLDHYAYRLGNMLLDQEEDAACLEITFLGPEIEILHGTEIVITGAAVSPRLNRKPIPMWTVVSVRQGDVLSFAFPQSGCRAYLCVRGGIAVEKVMGSRSTSLRLKIGGYEGRKLMAGDRVGTYQKRKKPAARPGIALPDEFIPKYGKETVVRVILGPQDNYFAPDGGLKTFLESEYQISTESNRDGFRLMGPGIAIKEDMPKGIITEAFPSGGIQVRPNGQPLVMMNDIGGGGYPKIAVIISVDLPRIAQLKPKNTVVFKAVTLDEAHQFLRAEHSRLNSLYAFIRNG